MKRGQITVTGFNFLDVAALGHSGVGPPRRPAAGPGLRVGGGTVINDSSSTPNRTRPGPRGLCFML
jgi:hypothetical protein